MEENQSYQVFGAISTLKHLNQLLQEVDGLKSGQDIEYLHRMRVASRRIRRNMEVFQNAFPESSWQNYKKNIKKITKTLGLARDLDVQVDFLENFKMSLGKKKFKKGIKYLIFCLKQKRSQEQEKIIKTISKLEEPLKEFSDFLKDYSHKEKDVPIDPAVISEQAKIRIEALIDNVLAFDPIVYQEKQVEELHQMRIAFKFLRYEMEIFESIYNNRFNEILKSIKRCQELLGDIHDADVWINYIPEFIANEEDLLNEYFKNHKKVKKIKKGLLFLKENRERFRHACYNEFKALWNENKSENLFEELKEIISVQA